MKFRLIITPLMFLALPFMAHAQSDKYIPNEKPLDFRRTFAVSYVMAAPLAGLSVIATPEERMLYYSQKALPESIAEISRNHENLTPVIEWLENSYLTSDTQLATQLARENEAKVYLTDALGAVVENINAIASQLDDLVNLQVDAVDGLTTQIQQIKTRLQVSKDQHGANRLRTLRTAVPQPLGDFSRKISVEEGALPTPGARMESFHSLYAPPSSESFQRIPLQARMSRFDDVGICLQREVNNSTTFSSSVYENARRKSVPGIPGSAMAASSPHASSPHNSMAVGSSSESPHQSMSLPNPPVPPSAEGAPPPLGSRPPPKLSSVTGPPPPLSRRVTNSSSGGG